MLDVLFYEKLVSNLSKNVTLPKSSVGRDGGKMDEAPLMKFHFKTVFRAIIICIFSIIVKNQI